MTGIEPGVGGGSELEEALMPEESGESRISPELGKRSDGATVRAGSIGRHGSDRASLFGQPELRLPATASSRPPQARRPRRDSASASDFQLHARSIGATLHTERAGVVRRQASVLQAVSVMAFSVMLRVALLAIIIFAAPCVRAQPAPSAPPAVGVITVERRPMTDSYEFNGRIQALNSVNIVARVTGFLDKQLFVEGIEA